MTRRTGLTTALATAALVCLTTTVWGAEEGGMRVHADLAFGSYQGSYIRHDTVRLPNAPARDHDTSHAYNGIGLGLDVGALFRVTTNFRIGPAAGLTFVPGGANDGNLCCASIKWAFATRLGPELEFTPDPTTGFHVRAGFGWMFVKPKISVRDFNNVDSTVRSDSFQGFFASLTIVRTTKVSDTLSIGGALRLDVARTYGSGNDFDGSFSSRWTTLTPSLAFTAVYR